MQLRILYYGIIKDWFEHECEPTGTRPICS